VTTRGRQYPDGPLVPDPDVIYRPLQQPAWPGSGTPEEFWPDGAGEILHNILGGSEPAPGPPYTHTIVPPEPVTLTSSDPEPPPGTVVRDDCGVTWERHGEDEGNYWLRVDGDGDSDPESWTKIAGNYGPVTVLEEPGPAFTVTDEAP
jgi:hypothetical protein